GHRARRARRRRAALRGEDARRRPGERLPVSRRPRSARRRHAVKQFEALYALILRSQATRARLGLLAALGVVAILIGIAIGSSDSADKAGTDFVNNFGLALVVPVTT